MAQAGLLALVLASILLLGTIDVELNETEFAIALAVFGVGAGLLLSQLGNVIMSSVDPSKTNEAGGLQGTAQNLGASLGTALIGAVLIAALTSGFVSRVEDNPAIPQAAREQVAQAAEKGIPVVPVDDVEKAATDAGLSGDQAKAVADDYGDAQLQGLKRAIGAVAAFALAVALVHTAAPRAGGDMNARDVGAALAEYRDVREQLERSILPLATSVDGRRFTFQTTLHGLELEAGAYVVLEGDGGVSARAAALARVRQRRRHRARACRRCGSASAEARAPCWRGTDGRSTTRPCAPRGRTRSPRGSTGPARRAPRCRSGSSRWRRACRSSSTRAGSAATRSCAGSPAPARPTRSACCSSGS